MGKYIVLKSYRSYTSAVENKETPILTSFRKNSIDYLCKMDDWITYIQCGKSNFHSFYVKDISFEDLIEELNK